MQNPPLKPTRIAGACAANTAMITWSDAYLLGWPAMDDTHREFVEVQGTGEGRPFKKDELQKLLSLGRKGTAKLCREQKKITGEL